MRNVIDQGNPEALEEHLPFGDGECVALVQATTDGGHTSNWRPGPRVVDLGYLNPGTVIANFIFDRKGTGRFPNRHGYHAALFLEFGPRNQASGSAPLVWIMDQWKGRARNTVHERYVQSRGRRSHAEGNPYADSGNADQYYVVTI